MTMTFAIGSALAGVASLLYVSSYPQITPIAVIKIEIDEEFLKGL